MKLLPFTLSTTSVHENILNHRAIEPRECNLVTIPRRKEKLTSDKTAGKDRRKRRGRDSISRETRVGAGNYRDYTIIIIDRPLNLRIC